jgi:hypothetical protein
VALVEAAVAGGAAAESVVAADWGVAVAVGAEAALFGDPPQPIAIIATPTREPHFVIP